jgi:hypothetical protein
MYIYIHTFAHIYETNTAYRGLDIIHNFSIHGTHGPYFSLIRGEDIVITDRRR